MNIIILGASGFIGTNLALELSRDKECHITLVGRDCRRLEKLKTLCGGRVHLQKSDLIGEPDLDVLLKGQDIVYHLISTTVPTTSNQQITKEIIDNVEVMARLLEACVRCHIKKIIFISSGGTVYGVEHSCPLREDMETLPINSYGMQKVMNEKLLYLYQYMYGLDYRIVRLANPYGPYQRPNGIQGAVTTFTYKALKQEPIHVYGDGSVVRDYIYIDDAIHGIITIANSDEKKSLFNVGSGQGVSICQLLNVLEHTLEIPLQIHYLPGRSVDVPVNYLDISKYERKFGELISVSLEEGIHKTVDFMRKVYMERDD